MPVAAPEPTAPWRTRTSLSSLALLTTFETNRPGGRVEVQFQHMKKPPFGDLSMRREIARRLNQIQAVSIPEDEDTLKKRPSIGLDLLVDPSSLAKFLSVFDWVLSEIRSRETVPANSTDSIPS